MKRLAFVLLLSLSYCAPAYAGAHNPGYPGDMGSAEDLPDYLKMKPIPGRKDVSDGLYEVKSMSVGAPPLSIRAMEASDHYADVVFYNTLTHVSQLHEGVNFVMPDGNIIIVLFEMRSGDTPDILHVIPPDGYYALPQSITVDENTSGTIQIHEGGLG